MTDHEDGLLDVVRAHSQGWTVRWADNGDLELTASANCNQHLDLSSAELDSLSVVLDSTVTFSRLVIMPASSIERISVELREARQLEIEINVASLANLSIYEDTAEPGNVCKVYGAIQVEQLSLNGVNAEVHLAVEYLIARDSRISGLQSVDVGEFSGRIDLEAGIRCGGAEVGYLTLGGNGSINSPNAMLAGPCEIEQNSSLIFRDVVDTKPTAMLDIAGKVEVGTVRDLEVAGDGLLVVHQSVDGLRSTSGTPRLRVGNHAVVHRIEGHWVIRTAQLAQIDGALGRTFCVESIDSAGDGKVSLVKGLALRNFTVPVSPAGLQVLNELQSEAATAIPSITAQLPGMRSERKQRGTVDRPPHDESLRADFASLLARLGDTKGASGSSRTKLAWLDYRMKLATAPSSVERASLLAYRLLGFGERPMPAIATYGVLAIVLSILSYRYIPGVDHRGDFLPVLRDWLLTPVHVLRLATQQETSLGGGEFSFIGRVLLAIPFVTAVLAFRNYLKRSGT